MRGTASFGVLGGRRPVVRRLRARRLAAFNLQLVDALVSMSNALRAGFSIQQAFESIVKEGKKPIAQEFSVFLQQMRIGVRFEDALKNLEERVGSEDLTLMVRAVEIARQTGGNLTETFDRIADTIRERSRIEGRIKALTAMGRLQGIVVGLIPVFLLFILTLPSTPR
jgi:tight adherence protein B